MGIRFIGTWLDSLERSLLNPVWKREGMLLNFAVVGGGPTGIEWSAELCDMIEEDMKHLYPDLVGYAKVRRSSHQTNN